MHGGTIRILGVPLKGTIYKESFLGFEGSIGAL